MNDADEASCRPRRRTLAALAALAAMPAVAARRSFAAAAQTDAAPSPRAGAASPAGTLRVAFPVAETGFDPQATSDLYSDNVQRAIFEPLFGFDYLARPYRRIPLTAETMPEVSAGGRVWTLRVRRGIHFADDPAFGARPRELVAADYVYSWKRLLDPRIRSPFAWYLQGKVVGADAVVNAATSSGHFDYDAPVEGLAAIDRYTIRIELKDPDFILEGYLCSSPMAAVAREVIERYRDGNGWAMDHPVGTGAFRLESWRRGQRIVLVRNPAFRDTRFPEPRDAADRTRFSALAGQKLPRAERVEITIMEEANPRLLAFDSGALDYVELPTELSRHALDANGALEAPYVSRGVTRQRVTQPALQYAYFNMQDPVVGGYTREKIALRRALGMAFDVPELIRVVYEGQAERATQPIPPGVPGHDATLDVAARYDPAAARDLLERFGYVDRNGDGLRELPDGRPLALSMASTPTTRDRELDEVWVKSLAKVGIRITFVKQRWPDLLKMGKAGTLQMWRIGWINAYAEADAFFQLLYGPNIGQTNYARFDLPEYNELYRKSRSLPDGSERNALYRKMSELIAAYAPWQLGVYPVENTLLQPWLSGYKKHAYWENPWLYLGAENRDVPRFPRI